MAMEPIDDLYRVPASDVKTRGWRGVMRTLIAQGVVLVTNHDEPEAVIIPAQDYTALVETAKQAESRTAADLEALRRRFDQRLAALAAPDAGARLRSAVRGPVRLRGKVKAGAGF
jgi:PHD/YefM family antitoxin component YafN of YafNO toxin-antitoxin module